jgi:hypothetical protein
MQNNVTNARDIAIILAKRIGPNSISGSNGIDAPRTANNAIVAAYRYV